MQTRKERRQQPDGTRTLMSLEFKTAKKSHTPIAFTVDDREMKFTPKGKSAGIFLAAIDGDEFGMVKEMIDWFNNGLSKKDQDYFLARLRDEDDDFDMDELQEIIGELRNELTGRPTT